MWLSKPFIYLFPHLQVFWLSGPQYTCTRFFSPMQCDYLWTLSKAFNLIFIVTVIKKLTMKYLRHKKELELKYNKHQCSQHIAKEVKHYQFTWHILCVKSIHISILNVVFTMYFFLPHFLVVYVILCN